MMRDRLLIGQYYPTNSPIHRLDARGKILATLFYMVALFVAQGWIAYAFMGLVFTAVLITARLPLKSLLRGLKLIIFFCILTLVMNSFYYPGETVLWQWHFLTLTLEGLIHGLLMAYRLLLLVAFASLLTLSTVPLELTDGLERLMNPFKRIGVPAHEIAMMMSIALRFIPTISEEFDRIMLAQRARGSSLAQGNLAKRVAAMLPLLVPLFASAFRRAAELAEAMEAKCYRGGEGRTRFKVMQWQFKDTLYTGFFVLTLVAMITLRVLVW